MGSGLRARSATFCVFMSIKRRVLTARKTQHTYCIIHYAATYVFGILGGCTNVEWCYWSQRCNRNLCAFSVFLGCSNTVIHWILVQAVSAAHSAQA